MKLPAHLSAFPGVARYMNYQRSFPTPTSARVDVPCLPYEAFTPDGTKINPWSIARLFESVRAFIAWPMASTEYPGSMAELHEILKDHLLFMVGARFHFERRFHDPDSPKFPLCVNVDLDYVGASSSRQVLKLHHAETDELYATGYISDVLVSGKTRQKAMFPEWWMTKYAPLCTGQRSDVLKLEEQTVESETICEKRHVYVSDTAAYSHTNWSSYVKFVFDSLQRNVQHDNYCYLNNTHLQNGVKTMDMVYKSESSCGDILRIQSWDTMDIPAGPVLNCSVTKGGKTCFQSRTTFYT